MNGDRVEGSQGGDSEGKTEWAAEGTRVCEEVVRLGGEGEWEAVEGMLREAVRGWASEEMKRKMLNVMVEVKYTKHEELKARLKGWFEGSVLIHVVLLKPPLRVVELLLEAGSDVAAASKSGWTALMLACWYGGGEDVVKALVEAGSDVAAASKSGWTALMLACGYGGGEDVVKALVEAGSDVAAANNDGWTALMFACWCGGSMGVVKSLLEAGSDVAAVDKNGWTALMLASWKNHCDLISLLLAHGANCSHLSTKSCISSNLTFPAGSTALDIARICDHAAVVDLLEQGKRMCEEVVRLGEEGEWERVEEMLCEAVGRWTNVRRRKNLRLSVMVEVKYTKHEELKGQRLEGSVLMHAVRLNPPLRVVELLLEAGLDAAAVDKGGLTALMCACRHGAGEGVVKALLEAGSDVAVASKSGCTALMLACVGGDGEGVVKALLEAGSDVAAANKNGRTALMLACRYGGGEGVVNALVEAGSDVAAADKNGWTALMFASWGNHCDLIPLLLNRGANRSHRSIKSWTSGELTFPAGSTALDIARICNHAAAVELLERPAPTPPIPPHPRMLLLDGGGTRGIISLRFLQLIEQHTGRRVTELFDFVAGTSIGGILTTLVFEFEVPLDVVERMYWRMVEGVFNKARSKLKMVGWGKIRSKYKRKHIKAVLTEIMDEAANIRAGLEARGELSQRHTRVAVIAQLDTADDGWQPYLFRNYAPPDVPGAAWGEHATSLERWWTACRATSAAPFYFPPADLGAGRLAVDGGLGDNCPVARAVDELGALGVAPDAIELVVSLGTGCGVRAPSKRSNGVGVRALLRQFKDQVINSQSVYRAFCRRHPALRERSFRLNPHLPPELAQKLDESNADNLRTLSECARAFFEDVANVRMVQLVRTLQEDNEPVEPEVHVAPNPAAEAVFRGLLANEPVELSAHEALSIRELTARSDVWREGGFGKVYRVPLVDGKDAAVKIVEHGVAARKGPREIECLRLASTLSHELYDCLVRLFAWYTDDTGDVLVMEFVRGGTLRDALKERTLDARERVHVAASMSCALSALHGMVDEEGAPLPVLHRDVKPENVVLDRTRDGRLVAKVCDFGSAKTTSLARDTVLTTRVAMTPAYVPPEVVEAQQYNESVVHPLAWDVYSFGTVVGELLCGMAVLPGRSVASIVNKRGFSMDAGGACTSAVLKRLVKLADKCRHVEPDKRPAMAAVRDEVLECVRALDEA